MGEISIFTHKDLEDLDRTAVPRHVAIIPDGNRRWARKNGLDPQAGHFEGLMAVTKLVQAAAELGIRIITLFTFSTENWARPKEEVDCLMELLVAQLAHYENKMVDLGVRLNAIGDLLSMPKQVVDQLQKTTERTKGGTRIELLLAPNYGSRDEMRRAIQKILHDYREGRLQETDLNEAKISSYLDTAQWGDPDLLIRTSGERRISNFLLWQLSYSELYFTDVLWPDFAPSDLLNAVLSYQTRNRRIGA